MVWLGLGLETPKFRRCGAMTWTDLRLAMCLGEGFKRKLRTFTERRVSHAGAVRVTPPLSASRSGFLWLGHVLFRRGRLEIGLLGDS